MDRMLRAFLIAPIALAGCGPTLADALGPDHTERDAPQCVLSGQSRPLVVDWSSTDRVDLEAAAHRGAVVVAQEGCKLRVLSGCRAHKEEAEAYGYVGVTPKQDKITMRDSAEIYANIPLQAVKFDAMLKHSGSLDVDMMIVGQYAATKPVPNQNELSGECGGATHVVTSLTVGAYSFYATKKGEEGVGVDSAFGSAGAKQDASKEVFSSDGKADACSAATGDDKKPPFGCGGLIRIELVPLGQQAAAEPTCAPGTQWNGAQCLAVKADVKCKEGEVADKEKGCVAKKAEPVTSRPITGGLVAPVAADCSDQATCEQRCNTGDAKGCLGLGGFLRQSLKPGTSSEDGKKAADAFKKSCEGGQASACTALGEMMFQGLGIAKDVAGAEAYLLKACDGGDYAGCNDEGLFLQQKGDSAGAAKYFEKSCNANSQLGCLGLGQLFQTGRGVPKDPAKAKDLLKKACDGKVSAACKLL